MRVAHFAPIFCNLQTIIAIFNQSTYSKPYSTHKLKHIFKAFEPHLGAKITI